MNIKIFFESLNKKEKEQLANIALDWSFPDKVVFTTISEFIKKNKISERLLNALLDLSEFYTHIEQLKKTDILVCRNAGKQTADEFIKLRGY